METVACNLCGSTRHKALYQMPDRRGYHAGIFTVVECNQCGLGFVNPRALSQTWGIIILKNIRKKVGLMKVDCTGAFIRTFAPLQSMLHRLFGLMRYHLKLLRVEDRRRPLR